MTTPVEEGADPRAGRDGLVRTAILYTVEGKTIVRPIQLVVPLEIGTDQGGEDVEERY
jgi:hypothetical protein